jgi:hypothetical protein
MDKYPNLSTHSLALARETAPGLQLSEISGTGPWLVIMWHALIRC